MIDVGDIVAVKGTGIFSRLIRDFSGPISHVGLITDLKPNVTQALIRVETISLADTIAKVSYAYILHPKTRLISERMLIANYALARVGEDYDVPDLLWQALDCINHTTYFCDHLASPRKVICSELVANAYGTLGLTFGISRRSATPTEIFNYTLAHPDQYSIECIKS
jgi:hypothetical protein